MAGQKPSLMSKLVKESVAAGKKKAKSAKGKKDFVSAMDALGYTSVFDIVRQPKSAFIEQLADLSDADGDTAYDSALCYATQIAYSWRRDQVSSGREQTLTARTGIRSLVDVGPSYPNLFKENWDEFCAVGAIAAVDSPVAYLNSLYTYIKTEIEHVSSQDGAAVNIPLDTRRPDLKNLILDQQSAFTAFPMLKIVQSILSKGIREYVDDSEIDPPHPGKDQSIYQLLKAKRHPFQFPYDFHHHQLMLGLSGKKKPGLGELSYRVSEKVPTQGNTAPEQFNVYGMAGTVPSSVAQCMMSGLSGELQAMVTASSLFATFYVVQADLEQTGGWYGTSVHTLKPWNTLQGTLGFVATGVVSADPDAYELVSGTDPHTLLALAGVSMKAPGEPAETLTLEASSRASGYYRLINGDRAPSGGLMSIRLKQAESEPLNEGAYSFELVSRFAAAADGLDASRTAIVRHRYHVSINTGSSQDYELSLEQRTFLQQNFAVEVLFQGVNPLVRLSCFVEQTGLESSQVDELLARGSWQPQLSANFIKYAQWDPGFPGPMHFGATYINGVGGKGSGPADTVEPVLKNAIGLSRVPASATRGEWYLTNASLNRFDRIQRMIRLQQALELPFGELDALIMAAIHSERDNNLDWDITPNTLRAIGCYRYLSRRYPIRVDEFAALLHFVSVFSSGDRVPLFDQVFNSPALFDTPLVLDSSVFDSTDTKTVAQLCAGLRVSASNEEWGVIEANVRNLYGPANAEGEPVAVGLRRNLATVSALYRQARIAQMFGLSVADCDALIGCLGGAGYRKRWVTGQLRGDNSPEATTSDILDILMQLDWAVGWLKEINLDVPTLLRLLGMGAQPTPSQTLIDQLNQLAVDTRALLVTKAQVQALDLPLYTLEETEAPPEPEAPRKKGQTQAKTETPIDWWSLVISALVTENGLVKRPDTDLAWDAAQYLASLVTPVLAELTFDSESARDTAIRVQATDTLLAFLLNAFNAQHRVFEGFLQANSGVSMEQTEGVMRWCKISPTTILAHMLGAITAAAPLRLPLPALPASIKNFVGEVQAAILRAEVTRLLNLSAAGLRTFIQNKKWLIPDLSVIEGEATLATFHAFNCYTRWAKDSTWPEEQLLAYLLLANTVTPVAAECAALLADSIGWTASEVLLLTNGLVKNVASSVVQVDWVRRVHAVCLLSGLSVAAVLHTTRLTPASTAAEWQAAGEAAMAASG